MEFPWRLTPSKQANLFVEAKHSPLQVTDLSWVSSHQSFDHPTDTWLPGAKLGYNKLTKEKLILTPWRNPQNSAPGIFSLEIEQAGSRAFLFRNGSAISIWDWQGDNHYCFYCQVNLNSVVNENESSLTYVPIDPNSFVRYKLLNGLLKFYNGSETIDTWGALGQCTNDVSCGAFSICDSQNLPHCRCLEGFEPKSQKIGNLEVKSIEECRLACSRDCSITAFAYNNDCKIWKGDIFNLNQLPYSVTKLMDGIKIHIRVADSTNKVKRKTTWIAIVVFVGFLSISTILIAFFKRKRSKGTSAIVQDSLVLFKYRDLRKATKNF
ncbi:G-type lectin S-receptor-like serine/threonine-protein kinase At2g19130 [Malus domestica]|uniref:G-type lectin S-receptor-like serine/threonine-protein kinase At2g19130 n=1 Tax=Malus domestica TaxID=3750 RepID=UPI003976244E